MSSFRRRGESETFMKATGKTFELQPEKHGVYGRSIGGGSR